jgi:Mg2+ and Co2+ transporter CorA
VNADRRKRVAALLTALEPMREQLAELLVEEQEAFEAMPESIQQGERGQASEDAASRLEDAHDNLDSAIESLEGIE